MLDNHFSKEIILISNLNLHNIFMRIHMGFFLYIPLIFIKIFLINPNAEYFLFVVVGGGGDG